VIQYLIGRYYGTCKDKVVVKALRTRAFYVAPRVNPDGVEDALDDRPSFHRSSVRHWPYHDGHRWPGLHVEDVDGDGRILTMRIVDPDGAWMEHLDEPGHGPRRAAGRAGGQDEVQAAAGGARRGLRWFHDRQAPRSRRSRSE